MRVSPSPSRRDPRERAEDALAHARRLQDEATRRGSAWDDPRRWLAVAAAFEVAADASEEAGWEGRAAYANAAAKNIYQAVSLAYEPAAPLGLGHPDALPHLPSFGGKGRRARR